MGDKRLPAVTKDAYRGLTRLQETVEDRTGEDYDRSDVHDALLTAIYNSDGDVSDELLKSVERELEGGSIEPVL